MIGSENDHGRPYPADSRSTRINSRPTTPAIFDSAVVVSLSDCETMRLKASPVRTITMTKISMTTIISTSVKPLFVRNVPDISIVLVNFRMKVPHFQCRKRFDVRRSCYDISTRRGLKPVLTVSWSQTDQSLLSERKYF